MPEMTMKHRCEHTTTLRWRGTGHRPYTTISHREQMHAEARAEWCADCRRSRQNQASVREATLNRWRPLVGTVRQVSWATTIRSEHLERCLDLIETGEWLRIAVADELNRCMPVSGMKLSAVSRPTLYAFGGSCGRPSLPKDELLGGSRSGTRRRM
jgi:hypothetical protein